MAPRNPLGKITESAQDAVAHPVKATEKIADRAVGLVARGVRAAASLINSAAGRAKGLVGMSEAQPPKPTDPDES